jgi:Neutral/alkaline non-lysosomal ceramidase, N-terminal
MKHALCLVFAAALAYSAEFRAGAARVDVTPAKDAALLMSGYASRTQGFQGIHDNLYVRAIVFEDGGGLATVISADVIGFSDVLAKRITERLEKEAGVKSGRVLLSAVHTHGAPQLGVYEGAPGPQQAAWVAKLEDGVVEAVRQAKDAMQPARAGFGTGRVNVNVNRRARMADGTWFLGINPDGPSDKTVAVFKFETLSGAPIAVFSNYAVHDVVMGPHNLQITGDLPGSAARYVEEQFGGKVIAPWTSGAAGDQNPIYEPGDDFDKVAVLGQILGEEIVRVAKSIEAKPGVRLRAAQTVVTCPGQHMAEGASRKAPKFVGAEPVSIRLSLLRIADVSLAGVSGEVLTGIYTHLKKAAGSRTVMVTNTNGSSGYIPDDAAYDQVSYEIVSTHLKRGCAENAIVKGFLGLMRQ